MAKSRTTHLTIVICPQDRPRIVDLREIKDTDRIFEGIDRRAGLTASPGVKGNG